MSLTEFLPRRAKKMNRTSSIYCSCSPGIYQHGIYKEFKDIISELNQQKGRKEGSSLDTSRNRSELCCSSISFSFVC